MVALECGWIVTEVGRQPWIVYNVMRTEDAVTGASGVWVTFSLVLALYAVLGRGARGHAARDGAPLAEAADEESRCLTGPQRPPRGRPGGAG